MNRFRTHALRKAAIVAVASTAATVALAQTATQPKDPNMPDAKNVPAEKVAPPTSGTTGSAASPRENLSDRLERTEGVIKPAPSADQEIVKPAPVPNPGTTPVITPPGEPGGNQNVQPK